MLNIVSYMQHERERLRVHLRNQLFQPDLFECKVGCIAERAEGKAHAGHGGCLRSIFLSGQRDCGQGERSGKRSDKRQRVSAK